MAVTVSPNVPAQASNWPNCCFASVSFCKYRIMVYISVIELLTGVPVAKIIPLLPVVSSM
jgi:hypothetical protein